jgi:hypothetical protein
VLEDHARPLVALGEEIRDEPGDPGPVGGGEWLAEAARDREDDVVGERGQHPPDVGGVQERQVGRADERGLGPVLDGGQPGRQPLHGPEPFHRVFDDLDPGRQLGKFLPWRGHDHHRAVDGPGDHGGRPVQQRRAVPFQRGLRRTHSRGPSPREHHTRRTAHLPDGSHGQAGWWRSGAG